MNIFSKGMLKKTSIDTDYNQQVKQFTYEQQQIPHKQEKLNALQSQYEKLTQKNMIKMTHDEIQQLYQIKDEIDELSKQITSLQQLDETTAFYLKNGELLMNYYDLIEHKTLPKTNNDNPNLLDFCKKNNSSAELPATLATAESKQYPIQRANLYEQYLIKNNPYHIIPTEYSNKDDYCHKCGEYRELITGDAVLVCPKCGDEVQAIMESDKPSYRDPPHENMYFAYKRINHFKEQLAHFQAKETTKIPQEVYDIILIEFMKENKNDLSTLTKSQVKKYLQKYGHLDYTKYYENINQIICRLSGIQPVIMTQEIEEQLCNMFIKIQEPFEKHCPPGRTNFLSYSYVTYKFCQLLGYTEYLSHLTLLKSKDKLRQQDKIWRNICTDMGWQFYPSFY